MGWVFHISLIAASKAEQSFGVGGQAPIVLALAPGCLRNYRIPLKADQEVIVCSEAKGTVEALPVDLGSEVRRRQVLARLAQREAPLRVDQARLGLLNGAPISKRNGTLTFGKPKRRSTRPACVTSERKR